MESNHVNASLFQGFRSRLSLVLSGVRNPHMVSMFEAPGFRYKRHGNATDESHIRGTPIYDIILARIVEPIRVVTVLFALFEGGHVIIGTESILARSVFDIGPRLFNVLVRMLRVADSHDINLVSCVRTEHTFCTCPN